MDFRLGNPMGTFWGDFKRAVGATNLSGSVDQAVNDMEAAAKANRELGLKQQNLLLKKEGIKNASQLVV